MKEISFEINLPRYCTVGEEDTGAGTGTSLFEDMVVKIINYIIFEKNIKALIGEYYQEIIPAK